MGGNRLAEDQVQEEQQPRRFNIHTLSDLAALPPGDWTSQVAALSGLEVSLLDRLRRQAVLQLESRRRKTQMQQQQRQQQEQLQVLSGRGISGGHDGGVNGSIYVPAWDFLDRNQDHDGSFDLKDQHNHNQQQHVTETSDRHLAAANQAFPLGPPPTALFSSADRLLSILGRNGDVGDVYFDLEGHPFATAVAVAPPPAPRPPAPGVGNDSGDGIGSGGGSSSGDGGGSGGGGVGSREYLWGVTVHDTLFDRAYAQDYHRHQSSSPSSISVDTSDLAATKTPSSSLGATTPAAASTAPVLFPAPSQFESFVTLPGDSNNNNGDKPITTTPSLPLSSSTTPSTHSQFSGLRYSCWWAHDAESEVGAFVAFVDWLAKRLEAFPDLKVRLIL